MIDHNYGSGSISNSWTSELIKGNWLNDKNDYQDELNGWWKASGYSLTFRMGELKGYRWNCPNKSDDNNNCFYPSDPED